MDLIKKGIPGNGATWFDVQPLLFRKLTKWLGCSWCAYSCSESECNLWSSWSYSTSCLEKYVLPFTSQFIRKLTALPSPLIEMRYYCPDMSTLTSCFFDSILYINVAESLSSTAPRRLLYRHTIGRFQSEQVMAWCNFCTSETVPNCRLITLYHEGIRCGYNLSKFLVYVPGNARSGRDQGEGDAANSRYIEKRIKEARGMSSLMMRFLVSATPRFLDTEQCCVFRREQGLQKRSFCGEGPN